MMEVQVKEKQQRIECGSGGGEDGYSNAMGHDAGRKISKTPGAQEHAGRKSRSVLSLYNMSWLPSCTDLATDLRTNCDWL
jgi:hypothetical protein